MATSITLDLTTQMNADSKVVFDTNGWDYVVVQLVTPSGAVSFEGSNDGGEVQGSTTSNKYSATNFLALAGQDLSATASSTFVTSANASKNIRFEVPPQYIRLTGTTITVTKLLVKLHKSF